jgi:leader peptidase (prepilin peptidase)/N-methyltransferase
MTAVVAALSGLVIGSFLNVVIHRVPLRKSIVWRSSKCPSCGERIKSFDNLPIISYLILRGRCRNCKIRISPRYPLVEALTGLLFGLAAYEFRLSLSLLWALVLISVLVVLAGTDLEQRLLPNAIVGPAAVVGLTLSVARDRGGWWVYLVSAVGIAAGLFALALAYPGGMRMGDVKMGGYARSVFRGVRSSGGLRWGARRRRRRWAPHGHGQDPAPERVAFRGFPGARRHFYAVSGSGGVGLVPGADRGGVDGARKV